MVKCVTIGWRGDAGERADALKGTRVSVRENGWRRGDGMGAGFRTGFRTVVRIFRTRLTGSHTTVRLFFRTRGSVRKNGCGISDGRAIFSDKTNWQPHDRAVIFSDTGERPKKVAPHNFK